MALSFIFDLLFSLFSLSVVTCPANAAGAPSCACSVGFSGTLTFGSGVWSGTCISASVVWQSTFNSAQVRSYLYSGASTTLTWTIQHNVCAANGKRTPGSSDPNYMSQYCSYSSSDNWVVTNNCNWASQGFTRVSGTLSSGFSYMCAHLYCDHIIFVSGNTLSYVTSTYRTINPGDSVFCSP
jgi:hypothetical protein